MSKQVVAQVIFDVTGDTNEDPAHPELENGLDQRHNQQQAGIGEKLPRGDRVRKTVDARLNNERYCHPYRLRNQQCSEAEYVTFLVAAKIRLKRIEAAQHD